MSATRAEGGEIHLAISACLLGQNVRFDGGHKRDPFLVEVLGKFVTFLPVCPELELGLGVPRPTIRLERRGEEVRLVDPKHGLDHTAAMSRLARARVDALAANPDLCGWVLKKDSPSCGLFRVKVWDPNGVPAKDGTGAFAAVLRERLPLLPAEEEGRLHDARLRENFYERVFAYRRLKDLFRGRWKLGDLVRFHTAEKLLLLAHDEPGYRALGRLVAGAKALPRAELAARYQEQFMRALETIATTRKHVNVLQHAAGFFKEAEVPDRRELAERIEEYRRGLVPLIVPITLLRHLVRRHGTEYLAGQTYLEPHPKELLLRNHV